MSIPFSVVTRNSDARIEVSSYECDGALLEKEMKEIGPACKSSYQATIRN